jgi:hypothetical protein
MFTDKNHMETDMEILREGKGELIGWHDPDDARDWVIHNKSSQRKNNIITIKEAVERFVHDGDYRVTLNIEGKIPIGCFLCPAQNRFFGDIRVSVKSIENPVSEFCFEALPYIDCVGQETKMHCRAF